MDQRIKSVVILGGGTAGWMTASYLAKALQGSVNITVLEAPSIPKIGVGEATVPNLHRTFFAYLGLSEEEWMRECNASFKMGIKFINWRTRGKGIANPRPLGESTDAFYHLFGVIPDHEQFPLSHYWFYKQQQGQISEPFDYACYSEPPALDAKLEPLESTGLYFVTAAIYQLAKHFPDKRFDQILIDRFNREIQEMFDDSRDFIQTHFYLSPRVDTPFWRANKELYLTDAICEKITMYRAGMPVN